MSTQLNSAEVLRFEIAVNAAAYRSLVAGLREQEAPAHSRRPHQRALKAAVELDLASQSYSVRALGRHRLPQTLSVKPGSRTHNNISSILASSLREQQADDLAILIENIIDATPTITSEHLQLFRNDIVFQPVNVAEEVARVTRTVAILATLAPTLLLDLDETPTLVVRERPEDLFQEALSTLRTEAHIASRLEVKVQGNIVEIATSITLPALTNMSVDLYMHWGGYDETAPAWQDELVASSEGSSAGTFPVTHTVYVPNQGHYGATFFLRPQGSTESVWLGRIGADDAHFFISRDDFEVISERDAMLNEMREIASNMLAMSVQHPQTLEEQAQSISSYAPHLGLGALLKQAVESAPGDEGMRALAALAQDPSPTEGVQSILRTYGVGELVFTTPEGPHAAAGGLAQVISGLPPELCKAGVPVTIITPLYNYENGNKHQSAQHLLSHGVQIGTERVQPRYVGSITVNVGPTYYQGTTFHRRPPSALPIKVFLAQSGRLRVFLLANASIFDRLYQPVYADEQLRRAVAFSRATLETIATSHFGIRPSAIVSNDWMTACVPAFAALDPHYQSVPWLKSAKTIHMIHNGGADYHGRLPINANNEDLWPLLNLAPEHFFGFRDPHNYNLINFTMAASQHVSGGILTVSQPYAHQISNLGGGDGIDYVLQHRRSAVFGISNGINRQEIDRYLASISGLANEELNDIEKLLEAKASTRARLQERFGLRKDENARLISFVGRMAEQKGLTLLSGIVDGTSHSALEELLLRNNDIQILVAGPTTDGDRTSTDLRNTLGYLAASYPGRVAAHFDYIPHSRALEIIFGSTLFLMPSRFEPGGITQLEALATGTLVIGRNVGGISATIDNFNADLKTGNGFLCNDYTPTAFANTAHWAIQTTRNSAVYEQLVYNARSADHTWAGRVPAYLAMLQRMLLGKENFEATPWNSEHRARISSIAVAT
jgi:starch synthase